MIEIVAQFRQHQGVDDQGAIDPRLLDHLIQGLDAGYIGNAFVLHMIVKLTDRGASHAVGCLS